MTTESVSHSDAPSQGLAISFQPPSADIRNEEAWVALIEPYLPAGIRVPHVSPSDGTLPLSAIAKIIIKARRKVDIDLIAFLGIEKKRWDAVHWICKGLIEEVGPPEHASTKQNELLSNMRWLVDSDNLSRAPVDLNSMTNEHRQEIDLRVIPKNIPINSIEKTIDDILSPLTAKSSTEAKEVLGEIWITLGKLILAAASDKHQSNIGIMPNVLRIIAKLHHSGWIPEAVYHDSHNKDPSALQQPPLLSELSSLMISALTEAAYLGEEGAVDVTSNTRSFKSRIFSRTPDKAPNLGPEIWLEFCLWCCVHGGWVHEGSAILDEMRRLPTNQRWSLIYWRDILESPEERWNEFTNKRMKRDHAETTKTPSRRELVQRTISAEAVIAIIDGMLSDMLILSPNLSTNRRTIERLIQLKKILDYDNMSLGVSSWDAVIARIADASDVDIENRPIGMERVLPLAETYGHEAHALNAPKSGDSTDPVASYVFDASAAVVGLHHRTLHAYIKAKDVSKAMRVLSKLQSLTDTNKMRSMEEFFRELQETPVATADTPEDSAPKQEKHKKVFSFHHNIYPKFPGVQYPGYFPAIPVTILASLLELLVDSNNHEIARWLLYSEDVDGPLITESMYGDQLIAPALIRFAAALPDAPLLLKVTEAQSTDISGPTLIALCQSRMRQRNFTGAREVLNLIQEYSIHDWNPEESATLVQSLLQIIHESHGTSSFEPIQLLQEILQSKFGKQWGDRPSQLDTVVGVLSDISPDMRHICAGLLQSGSYYRKDMSAKTFNTLLDGTIRTLGVDLGQRIVQDWCIDIAKSRQVQISEEGSVLTSTRASPAAKFFGAEQQHYNPGTAVFEGIIQHDVETIRTVIAGILRGHGGKKSLNLHTSNGDMASASLHISDDSSPSVDLSAEDGIAVGSDVEFADDIDHVMSFDQQHPIMEWAVNILRQDFSMTNTEINDITQGYLTSQHPDTALEEQQP